MDRAWFSVQALLIAAANISKLLYSPEPKNKEFRESNDNLKKKELAEIKKALCESLGITESSILISKYVRKIRNNFEHFDERLHDQNTLSKRRNSIDLNIGDISSIEGFDPEGYLRNLNPYTWELIFRGEVYNLKAIIQAVQALHSIAENEFKKQDNKLAAFCTIPIFLLSLYIGVDVIIQNGFDSTGVPATTFFCFHPKLGQFKRDRP